MKNRVIDKVANKPALHAHLNHLQGAYQHTAEQRTILEEESGAGKKKGNGRKSHEQRERLVLTRNYNEDSLSERT